MACLDRALVDLDDVAALDRSQRSQRRGREWYEVRQSIGRGNQDENRAIGLLGILLVSELLINRQQYVESLGTHQLQQFSVLLSRPSHCMNRADVVARQLFLKSARHAFV